MKVEIQNYTLPEIRTYEKGEYTDLQIGRELLYRNHVESAKKLSGIYGDKIEPSQYKSIERKINNELRNLLQENRSVLMSMTDRKVRDEIARMNEVFQKAGLPPMTDVQMERLQNSVIQNLQKKFKGATFDQRMKVSQRLAKNRLKSEVLASQDKRLGESAKNRVTGFLTDRRENGRSLVGGSNFKYNERILVSEYNRAKQETMKEVLAEYEMLARWTLSADHKLYDICDILATETGVKAERFIRENGLDIEMEGVYEPSELPEYPHPYCQCDIVPVITDYGLSRVTSRQAFAHAGEDLVDYEDGFISPESQAYLSTWLANEYKEVKPMDYTRRSAEEVAKQLEKIERQTQAGLNGVVTLRNKPLQKYVQRGGMRAYEEIAKNTLGKALDPEIVEKIGVDNAIKLLARDLKAQGKADLVVKALEDFNANRLPVIMRKSQATARGFMQEADAYRRQIQQGTPRRAVNGLRTRALMNARQELGDAIGYAEMHERLLRELRSPSSIDFLNIRYRNQTELKSIVEVLGLERLEYTTVTRNRQRFLTIGDSGMAKVSQFYEGTGKLTLSKELEAIRAGRRNKKGWIPANFKREFIDKSTGKLVKFELKPDQQTGIRFIKENKVAILHYKPGAGKTHTALGAITELHHDGKVKKVLVVTKSDLVKQFNDEIKHFTEGITSRPMTYQGKAQRIKEYFEGDQLITIISHSQLKNDAEALRKAGFDMVIVDEIHELTSDMYKALKGIKVDYKVGMTGTAIKDSISDIYDMVDWLSPNTLPPRYKFDRKYNEIVQASSIYEQSALRDLRDTVKPLMITKDSPVKARLVPVTRRIRVTEAQRKQIIKIEEQAIKRRESGQSRAQVEAWRDRQLGKIVNAGDAETNAKLAEVKKIIENNPKEKIIIFASDRDAMKTIQSGLGDKADYYTTSSTKAQRDAIIKNFRSDPNKRVLVLSDAGATGLNLEVANIAIHWDMPDKFYKLEQRQARNWRGLKTETTYQYFLQTDTSYDARTRKSLEESRTVSESLKIAESLDELGLAKTIQRMLRRGFR